MADWVKCVPATGAGGFVWVNLDQVAYLKECGAVTSLTFAGMDNSIAVKGKLPDILGDRAHRVVSGQ